MDEELPNYSSASFLPFESVSSIPELYAQSPKRHRKGASVRQNTNTAISQHVPWKLRECYTCGVMGLHEEINDFYEKLKPTEQENEVRMKVVEHITRVVHQMWPLAKVEIFGSFRTGLYLPSSDIDMVVIGQWRSLPLSTLSIALQLSGIDKSDIEIIDNAKVPLVRIVHTLTKIKVDVSFNLTNGVESAKMVKSMMKQFPTLPKLILVLKQYLVQRGLNEVYSGGMSSYCLTLLLVSFLQGNHKPQTLPSTNLGTLLLEFFELYGINFNYQNVSINFDNGGKYEPKYRSRGTCLNIEDPLAKGNNVAKGTYLMHMLKLSFENAFHILHKAVIESASTQRPLNSYLSCIVSVDESVWERRMELERNYSNILLQFSQLMALPENEQANQQQQALTKNPKPNMKAKRKKSNEDRLFKKNYF